MLTLMISAVITGAIVGGLGRLLLPGRQDIGWLATIAVGIVAAAVAVGAAYVFGFHERTWLAIVLELALAVAGVAVVANLQAKRRSS